MGPVRPAQFYDAVQRSRLSGDLGLLRVWRRRAAGLDPARRQAVPGADPVSCRRRLREGNAVPRRASGPRHSPRRGLRPLIDPGKNEDPSNPLPAKQGIENVENGVRVEFIAWFALMKTGCLAEGV